MPDATPRGFGTTWQFASAIPGWLTEDQAGLLWDTAAPCLRALLLEIGSHQGRSTVVLAAAAQRSGPRGGGGPVRGRPALRRRVDSRQVRATCPRPASPRPSSSCPSTAPVLGPRGPGRWTTCTSTASTTTGRSRMTCDGASTSRAGLRSSSTTATPRSGSRSGSSRTCCPRGASATSGGSGRWPCSGSVAGHSRPGPDPGGSSHGGSATS